MIRQAGLMLPRKEYKEPLYRLRQNEYCILLMFEGNLGNKPINRYVSLRANERRYRSGEESWHRGSVVAKKK